MEKSTTKSVVLEDVKASELPAAWRRRVRAAARERLTVTIARRISGRTSKQKQTHKRPNSTFGMWADRVDVDPAEYVRAIRRPRHRR